MTILSLPRTRRGLSLRLALIAAAAAAGLAGASSAVGATVTKTRFAQGIPGFPGALGGLGVFEAGTPVPPPDAVREVGAYDIVVAADDVAEAPFAGAFRAYAVTDIRYHTDNGVAYPMLLQTAPTFAGEFSPDVAARLTWLLRNSDALAASEPDTQRAAAAIQIAVWQTLRNPPAGTPRADLDNPTDDPSVNALAAKFIALTEASFDKQSVALGISAGPASGCSASLTITGTPGAAVSLAATNGGVLGAQAVVLGADGTATVMVTAPAGATVAVDAHVLAGGELVRADGAHDPDIHIATTHLTKAPEELIFLAGAASVTATSQLSCPPAPGPPAGPGVVVQTGGPTPVAAGARGKLRVVKTGPLTAVAGQVVTYRIRVTNTGSTVLQSVALRDVLPSGLTVFRKPSGASVKRRVVVWTVAALSPGTSRNVSVKVRIDRGVTGTRCNKAEASTAQAATARATACTAVRSVAGASRVPPVTG